jgi:uncharacterized protein YqhQ
LKEQIGGQALVEGVMMKSRHYVAAAARRPDGTIARVRERFVSAAEKSWFFRLPLVRGAVVLFEMLVLGLRMLEWSANQQAKSRSDRLSAFQTGLTMVFSFGLAIVLFILVPYWLSRFFVETRGVVFSLIDGFFRITIFVCYIAGISLLRDVRRMFEYHGAEHMAVHCYEAGKPLTPANARHYSPVHLRCGTSLLVFVIVVSILAFSLVRAQHWYINVPLRVLLIPVIAGAGYELVRLSARFPGSTVIRALTLPGLWVQKITTRRPGKGQVEVAIAALKGVI